MSSPFYRFIGEECTTVAVTELGTGLHNKPASKVGNLQHSSMYPDIIVTTINIYAVTLIQMFADFLTCLQWCKFHLCSSFDCVVSMMQPNHPVKGLHQIIFRPPSAQTPTASSVLDS